MVEARKDSSRVHVFSVLLPGEEIQLLHGLTI
jgi:hypothetical protein